MPVSITLANVEVPAPTVNVPPLFIVPDPVTVHPPAAETSNVPLVIKRLPVTIGLVVKVAAAATLLTVRSLKLLAPGASEAAPPPNIKVP